MAQAIRKVDILGLGFGPSNIALAIALKELGTQHSCHFLEANETVSWQPGMMMDGADIQHHPLRDLVTPRNPRSRYGFLSYLHEQGRLYEFLNLGTPYAFRREYADYISWCAGFFSDQVTLNARVSGIRRSEHGNWIVESSAGSFQARALVLGTGRTPNIPEVFHPLLGGSIFHLTRYAFAVEELPRDISSIAVIGASQSAAEIHLDLRKRFPHAMITAVHRGFSMKQKDTSPFSEEIYFPQFTDYFFNAGKAGQKALTAQLGQTIYGAADHDVLQQLYLATYEDRLKGVQRFQQKNNVEIEEVLVTSDHIKLRLRECWQRSIESLEVQALILATGFLNIGHGAQNEPCPPLLTEVFPHLKTDHEGVLEVPRNYQVSLDQSHPIFLNGLCESSHGFADAGSFSLLAVRAQQIHESLHQCLQ